MQKSLKQLPLFMPCLPGNASRCCGGVGGSAGQINGTSLSGRVTSFQPFLYYDFYYLWRGGGGGGEKKTMLSD